MVSLDYKRDREIVPQYSLTGDLISYLRCGLQYRYHGGSELPPSRPVQLWFGEFLHGVLESAFRIWKTSAPSFPWPCNPTPRRQPPPTGRLPYDIGTIGDVIEGTLRSRGKNPRSNDTRLSAYRRVHKAVNELGPHLFPLISSAEEPVIGTREVPDPGTGAPIHRAKLYELHGIIDVVTDLELSASSSDNIIRAAIQQVCPNLAGQFEVIVDYKGSRRPPTEHDYWHQGNWQLQTYAWLRRRQPNSLPVAAGVLLYLNELAPGADDLSELKKEIQAGKTDIGPAAGSPDAYKLSTWRTASEIPDFSVEFRIARTMRVIAIDEASQTNATGKFDATVLAIEERVAAEAASGKILGNWSPCGDEETCVACDFRHFCPDPAPRTGPHIIKSPPAP
jgi:hypothetical protein